MLARIALFVEYHIAVGILQFLPNDASGKIYIVVALGELSKLVHVIIEYTVGFLLNTRGITVQLAFQHAIGSLGILVGAVCLEVFLHFSAAIELVGSSQVTTLHLHKDVLGINEATLREIEIDACTQEFLCKHRYIEMIGVIASKITTGELLIEGSRQLLEGWCILHIIITDPCKSNHLFRDWLPWIDKLVFTNLCSIWIHLDIGDLDDSVFYHVKTGSL